MALNNCHQLIVNNKLPSLLSSLFTKKLDVTSIVTTVTSSIIYKLSTIITYATNKLLTKSRTTIQKYKYPNYRHRYHQCNKSGQISGGLYYYIAILFICTIFLDNGIVVMGDCPRLCECKWKSGKESVLCLNANLSSIPIKLDTGTQILDLTGNDITTISHDIFANSKLLNLQKIFMSKCRLRLIERFAFRNLTNLVELDLSYNQLTMIPSHAFDSIPELREIKLNGNPIQRIFNDAFARVPQLVRLELSDCKISIVETLAFNGLESTLEWLKLDGNKIIDIRSETLTELSNLHGLELARNLWNCSCHLRPLRAWMLRENIPYGIPPVCRMPGRLNGKSWDKIDLDDFACVPQIMAPDTRAHGVEGRNITMSCYVEGIPEPNVRWIVKNRIIANLTGVSSAGGNGEAASLTTASASKGKKMYMVNLLKNSSNLTILTADVQDAGIYTCAAENKAGRVEASVTLAVSRKPPEAPLGAKIILICVLVALIFVVGLSFTALCFFSLRRKRRKMGVLWRNAPARSDSYEKIEMNRKPDNGFIGGGGISGGRSFGGVRIDDNSYMTERRLHGGENGIAIVQPLKKNGEYRNVPTDDDGTGYEDNNILDSTFSLPRRGGDNIQPSRWKDTTTMKSPKDVIRKTTTNVETDLHIPRLIDLSSNSDSVSSSVSSQVDAAALRLSKSTSSTAASIYTQSKLVTTTSPWSNQLFTNKKPSPLISLETNHSPNKYGVASEVNSSIFCSSQTPDDPLCDLDRTYPDLLDVYKYSNSASITNTLQQSSSNAFCTLPRKFKNSTKHFRTTSDSQSPLLPECSSKYGSSQLGDISFTDFPGRRFSAESYINYTSGLQHMTTVSSQQRSNSFLSLVQTSNKITHQHRRNPSLPSSPIRDTTITPKFSSSVATPLLDFTTLMSNHQNSIIPSTSNVNAYDYHAAQLERFLEEYRNLQDQLCKMKETCESIRKKEVPLRAGSNFSDHSSAAQFADPVMFNAAIAESSLVVEPPIPTKLKNKNVPGKQPDPPPYWLHRNAMLKRLNDSQSEFFQS